jgi:hypothetical protein
MVNGAEGMDFSLPLVSVVVVNHNYGRFLQAAVDSIYAQTYPRVECIVVDNGSTDCSAQVLEQITLDHPDAIVIRRRANDGQSIASLEGFRTSHGQYVVFLDADDLLLPEFVRSHVFVHLSTRIHIGLTSSDILQVVDGQIVVATGLALNNYIRFGAGPVKGLTRPFTESLKSFECFDGFDETVLDRLHLVPPGTVQWVWSPTSANLYRRDALDLIMDARKLPALRASTDVFCCVGVNGLCGGLLIDRALSVYRIHGANFGTEKAQLQSVHVMRDGKDLTAEALEALIDHLTEQGAGLIPKMWDRQVYLDLLASMAQRLATIRPPEPPAPPPPVPRKTRRPASVRSKLAGLPGRIAAMLPLQWTGVTAPNRKPVRVPLQRPSHPGGDQGARLAGTGPNAVQ